MADQKFSELTEKTTAADTDELPLVNNATVPATSRRITFANFAASVLAKVASLTGKTTPIDADGVLLTDSAASNAAKFLTWANLKTAIFGALNGLTGKSTPASGDVFLLGDSAASYAGKKITYDELQTALAGVGSWRAHTAGGVGSTATKILYFNTVVTNNPNSKFTITNNNSTNGLAITINTAGRYAISLWFDPSGGDYSGISLNASSLTTSISSIAAAERLGMQFSAGANQTAATSVTIRLAANDVIRPHVNTGSVGTAANSGFAIEFLGV